MKTEQRLTRREADALFREYRQTPSVKLRNHIAEKFFGLVKKTATVMASRLAGHLDPDELIAFGMPGLLWAVEHYDPENGAAFTTFASRRIYGAIMDEIRGLDYVPRLTRNRARRIDNGTSTFYATHGREPTPAELQCALGVDDKQFKKIAGDTVTHMESLSEEVSRPERYRCKTLGMMIAARPDVEPCTKLDTDTILRDFVLPHFGLRHALVLRMYYIDSLPMREIGEALRIGESRISQMHSTLIDALRERFNHRDRGAA